MPAGSPSWSAASGQRLRHRAYPCNQASPATACTRSWPGCAVPSGTPWRAPRTSRCTAGRALPSFRARSRPACGRRPRRPRRPAASISGGVSRPTSVLVRMSRKAARQFGGVFRHRRAHRDEAHVARQRNTFLAVLELGAQRFGLLGAGLERRGRRAARHHEQDRSQRVVVGHGGRRRAGRMLGVDLAIECRDR